MILTCLRCFILSELADLLYEKEKGEGGLAGVWCPICKSKTLHQPTRIGRIPP